MYPLKNFGVANFRNFKDLQRFEFAPITILTGTNSSGKSSLTKAILCLKNNFTQGQHFSEFDIPYSLLNTLNPSVELNLGNFNKYINRNSQDNKIVFELPCQLSAYTKTVFSLIYSSDQSQINNGRLERFEIFELENRKVKLMTYDRETGDLWFNFTKLYWYANEDMQDKYMIWHLQDQIEEKCKLYKIDLMNEETVPEDILELQEQQQILYDKSPFLRIDNRDVYYFYNDYSYYKHNEVLNQPLREYSCLYHNNEILLKELYEVYISEGVYTSDFSFDDFVKMNKIEFNKLFKIASAKNMNVAKYILTCELTLLDKIIFSGERFNWEFASPDFEDVFKNNFKIFSEELDRNKYNSDDIIDDNLLKPNRNTVFKYSFDFICSNHLKKLQKTAIPLSVIQIIMKNRKKNNNDETPHNYRSNFSLFLNGKVFKGIENVFASLNNVFGGISYIPSVRAKISRRFELNTSEVELNKQLKYYLSGPSDNRSIEFLNKYLKIFNIADNVEMMISEDSLDSRIIFTKDDIEFDLAELGYGISQIFPIILKIVNNIHVEEFFEIYGIPTKIIIIEEPETNLHPALQSKLADMFVECYKKYNIQFIIETHSEYLIRKLQYLTAKKEITPEMTQLYYFNPGEKFPKGKKQVEKINILKDGRLDKEFGTGFFDESTKLMMSILTGENLN